MLSHVTYKSLRNSISVSNHLFKSNFIQKAAFTAESKTKRISTISQTMVPNSVRIVEVGPRDGLQNEKTMVPAEVKLALIDKLYNSGLRSIEAGAFVSPKWVPQMADTEEIFKVLAQKQSEGMYPGATFSALTPNLQGIKSMPCSFA
jgi:hydroxymethylglutaryl-CoA lyase